MTRRIQLRLLARAALFAVPGVRLAQRPTQDGAELVIDLADDATVDEWVKASGLIVGAGLVKGKPFGVYAGEWRLAIRDALAELQREADTADHGERPPVDVLCRLPGMYNVALPDGQIVCQNPRDMLRCLGHATEQCVPARVLIPLPEPVPEHIDDAQTQPYRPGNA